MHLFEGADYLNRVSISLSTKWIATNIIDINITIPISIGSSISSFNLRIAINIPIENKHAERVKNICKIQRKYDIRTRKHYNGCIAANSEDYTTILGNVVLIYNDGTRTIFTYTSKTEYKPGLKELQTFFCIYVHQI